MLDSGSLGDFISTTVADQLSLKLDELAEPITLHLAVQYFLRHLGSDPPKGKANLRKAGLPETIFG